MTYYVQKKIFNPGDVADGDDLMGEFYNAAAAISSIDQNNIAPSSINYSVAIPPDPTNSSDRQRGPFACYDDLTGAGSAGLLFSTDGQFNSADLTANRFTDYVHDDWELNFSSKTAATYTFMFHATATGTTYSTVDVIIKLNGVPIGQQESFTGNINAPDALNVPIFMEVNHFIEPSTYHVTVAIRPRGLASNAVTIPTINHMTIGIIGFIR